MSKTPREPTAESARVALVNAEKRESFVASAIAARLATMASGKGYAAEEVHAYARARARKQCVRKPEAISWRKQSALPGGPNTPDGS